MMSSWVYLTSKWLSSVHLRDYLEKKEEIERLYTQPLLFPPTDNIFKYSSQNNQLKMSTWIELHVLCMIGFPLFYLQTVSAPPTHQAHSSHLLCIHLHLAQKILVEDKNNYPHLSERKPKFLCGTKGPISCLLFFRSLFLWRYNLLQ